MSLDRSRLIREGRQISAQWDQMTNRALTRTGITGVQAQMLLYLLRGSGTGQDASVTAMHRVTGHAKATISHLVKRLREEGYVRVESCAGDDRRKLLAVTDRGKRLRPFLEETIREAEDVLYRGFSPGELAELDHLQQKMIRNLSERQTDIQREASKT